VILSAGAIISPKLLQLSGVGRRAAAADKTSVGIPLVQDSAGSSRNLREHWLLDLQYALKDAR